MMIRGIGKEGLAQAAIEAALRKVAQSGARVDEAVAGQVGGATSPPGAALQPAFESVLSKGLAEVDRAVQRADSLPIEMLQGKLGDFHEIAGQLKQAEIAFKFSLEVRNKLIDAYRETMRMSV